MRLSQQHYAALDAYCLIPIMRELSQRALCEGTPALLLEANVHSMRWTGGDMNNKPPPTNAQLSKEQRDRNKRTKKRAE